MPVQAACDCCGRDTPIYRLASIILDGRMARVCPRCAAAERDRASIPYSPRPDQGAIQPSTSREAW